MYHIHTEYIIYIYIRTYYIYICYVYLHIYIKYTHKETYTTYPLFFVCVLVYPIRDNFQNTARLSHWVRSLTSFPLPPLDVRKFVHHQPSDPNKTSPVPGTRLEVISGWSLRDDFFWAFFFVVVDLRNRQFARKREEPEFFWGLGGCGLRCVPPSFFLERKNHLEWVGIFSFLPQLGSFAGSRNTSGRTGSWTLSNMWNKKSNQNLTQIPTTRGSTNSFAGWNEDVFTIQKKWWHFFQPAFGIC